MEFSVPAYTPPTLLIQSLQSTLVKKGTISLISEDQSIDDRKTIPMKSQNYVSNLKFFMTSQIREISHGPIHGSNVTGN